MHKIAKLFKNKKAIISSYSNSEKFFKYALKASLSLEEIPGNLKRISNFEAFFINVN